MTLEELNREIKSGNVRPFYFFYGEEQYLLSHKVKAIEQKLVAPGMEDFNLFRFEGKKTDIESVFEAVEQFPQMSEKKVVVVKNSEFLHLATAKSYKRIKEELATLPDYTCLILVEEDFDKKKEKSLSWIENGGGMVRFDYLPVNKVEIWVEEQFLKAEKKIAPKEVSYLVRLCGQSLGKLRTQIQKVLNYVGNRSGITRDDLEAVVDKSTEYRVFDMMNNVLSGQNRKVMEQVQQLKKNPKEQPPHVLKLMMDKLSEMILCKNLRDEGVQAEEILSYFDTPRPIFVVNKTIQESKRYGEAYLKRMLRKGLLYDAQIKTGKIDGWTAVDMFVAELIKK